MHDVAALKAWSVQIGSCGLTNYGPVETSPLRTQGFRHSSALSPYQRRKTGALFIKIGCFEFVRQRHRTPNSRSTSQQIRADVSQNPPRTVFWSAVIKH
jgi:hypothetical protein